MGVSAAILAGITVATTGYSVAGDIKGAKAAKKTANFQAGILDQQANDTIGIGNEAAGRSEASSRGLTGAQRVSQAATGVDISSGSAADVISNDQKLGAIEAQTIRNNAAREALGLRKQATLVRMGGQQQATGYKNQATGSLLSGAASLYGIYDKYGRTSRTTTPRASYGSPSSGSGGSLDPFAP